MKSRGGGVSPVQPPHIFPRKGYNLHEPTKGQEQSTRCQLHPSSQHIFSSSFPFGASLVPSRSLSVCLSQHPFHLFLRDLLQSLWILGWVMLVCVRVCYSKTVCLLAILVFAACGWQEVVFHSSFNVSHPPHIHYGENTQRGREVKNSRTANVERAWH